MSEWQPIETAPKDGTWILIYEPKERGYSSGGITYVASWDEYQCEFVEAYGEEYTQFNPTHWMPLPAPPVTE